MAFNATNCFRVVFEKGGYGTLSMGKSLVDGSSYYFSLDGETWVPDTITTYYSQQNATVYIKGTNFPNKAETALADACRLTYTDVMGPITFYGSIMSLVDDGEGLLDEIADGYGFAYLFAGLNILNVKGPSILPATKLSKNCYKGLFYQSNLEYIPDSCLPATELAEGCYSYMFARNSNFRKSPKLPAKNLAKDCYKNMFEECAALTRIDADFLDFQNGYGTENWILNAAVGDFTFYCNEDLIISSYGDSSIRATDKTDKFTYFNPDNCMCFTTDMLTHFYFGGNDSGIPSVRVSKDGIHWYPSNFGISFDAGEKLYFCGECWPCGISEYGKEVSFTFDSTSPGDPKPFIEMHGSLTSLHDSGAGEVYDFLAPGAFDIRYDTTLHGLFGISVVSVNRVGLSKLSGDTFKFKNIQGLSFFANMFWRCRLSEVDKDFFKYVEEITQGQNSLAGFFRGNSFLKNLPKLPDVPIDSTSTSCFVQMFKECTSLEKVDADIFPENLVKNAPDTLFMEIFKDCRNLNNIEAEYIDWEDDRSVATSNPFYNWCDGVSSTGTFAKKNELADIRDSSHIPFGWTVKELKKPLKGASINIVGFVAGLHM